MLRTLRRKFLHFFRRLLGTDQILYQQQQQQQLLLSLGNGLKYFLTDAKKVKESATYKRCAEIVSLFSPMNIEGAKYIRVGKKYDGGYVMLDNFQDRKIEAAYSFGIDSDVSWDEAVACRGINVFMYDHTIERLPKHHRNFHYFKIGVTGHKKRYNLKTLSELIIKNNHAAYKNMIIKIDIEGCEWDVLNETPSSVINQFSQLIVEFHNLKSALYGSNYNIIVDVLKKIHQTHQSIHVHANGISIPLWIGEFVLPSILEVTYVRRSDFKDKLIVDTRQFPTEIDCPTSEYLPDIYLSSFSEGQQKYNTL